MQPTQTKLALVPTVGRNSSGRSTSSAFSARRDSTTSPSAAGPVARESATRTASAEILRARDLLRDLLLRDDDEELGNLDEPALAGQVSSGINEICSTLDSLAGLQMMFEAWSR